MKKLAIIGLVVVGLIVSMALPGFAIAKPISDPEYQMLPVRGERIYQLYRLDAPVKGENYYARGLPTSVPSSGPGPSTSTDFQWGDAGIGAGSAFGLAALVAGGMLVLRRQRGHLRTS
jgi:hypothetical protein